MHAKHGVVKFLREAEGGQVEETWAGNSPCTSLLDDCRIVFVHSKSILHETFPFEDNAMTQVRPTVVKWRKSRA